MMNSCGLPAVAVVQQYCVYLLVRGCFLDLYCKDHLPPGMNDHNSFITLSYSWNYFMLTLYYIYVFTYFISLRGSHLRIAVLVA
jgi:hypothetical protein